MPAALTPRNSSSAQQLPSPFPCGPRAACFVLRHRRGRPRGLARHLHPLAPVLPGNSEARASRSPSVHPALSRHAPSAAHSAPSVRAHRPLPAKSSENTPRACPGLRPCGTRHPPTRPATPDKPPSATSSRVSSRLREAALLHHAPRPRRQGRDTLHRISPAHPMQARGPTIPTRATQSAQSSPSPHNAACTPASAHRSTARKSPVLPAGRTGREASEASTAARSAADSLKWLSP